MFDRPVQKKTERSAPKTVAPVDPVIAAPVATRSPRGFSLADIAITVAPPDRGGLPAGLKRGVEALSGIAMDDVRVHRHSAKPRAIGALAFAQGTDIHLAPGEERHLPHEAWHVVQQKQGRVKATRQLKAGVPVNDDAGLEVEADAMGARAAAFDASAPAPTATIIAPPSGTPVQRTVLLHGARDEEMEEKKANKGAKRARAGEQNSVSAAAEDEKVLAALEAQETTDHLRAGVGAWAYTHLHKGTAEIFSIKEALEVAEQDLDASTVGGMGDHHTENWPTSDQPRSLVKLHQTVQHQVDNYAEWLGDDATWESRSEKDKARRARALKLLAATENYLAKAQEQYPLKSGAADRRNRNFKIEYDKDHRAEIDVQVDKIHRALEQIDKLVTEPPVPPKDFGDFKGDTTKFLYGDGKSDATAIRIKFYKQKSDYQPIVVPKGNRTGVTPKTYYYPNGPTVRRLNRPNTWFNLTVAEKYQFGDGTILTNTKKADIRAVQIDINKALVDSGVNMNGKDGDHVRDLGFGGADEAANYWPLAAKINRRPFNGWRTNYGLNYVSDQGYKTASITALAGKKLRIDGFMGPSGEPVPDIGKKPEPESGAIGEVPASDAATNRPASPSLASPAKRSKTSHVPASTANKSSTSLFKAKGKGARGRGQGKPRR